MEVKINVLNEMHKLRNTTYSDRYTWIDELIQNCQRSGATRIDVTIDEFEDKIVVSDNGYGCTNPQVLFEKNSSDWDEITTKNQSPFGEGFFSTMMAADTISVSSVGFDAVFDVKRMFEENTVKAIDVTPNKKTTGFTVTLTNIRNEMSFRTIMQRFKNTAKYIKKPTTYINTIRVNYEGLTPKNPHTFMLKVNNEMFNGWIQPHAFGRDGWTDANIKTFAYSRQVKDMTDFTGVLGVINFKDNVIGLRSPDRHEFIIDDRYERLKELLTDEIKKMYLKILRTGTDTDIKDYQYYIQKYLDTSEYKSYVKFKFFNQNKSEKNKSKEPTIEQTYDDDYDTYGSPNVSHNENKKFSNINETPVQSYNDLHVETAASMLKDIIPERKKQTGDSIDKLKYGFYLKPDEMKSFVDAIDIANYYNIPIIEIRNNLEENCIQEYQNIKHISELTDNLSIRADFTNMTLSSEPEIRAYKVLNSLSKIIADDDHMFIISDTDSYKVLKLDDEEFKIEKLDTFATAYGGNIYINRKRMRGFSNLRDNKSFLTAADKRFLLLNLETIAHEMSHVLYGTNDNTKEHFDMTNKLMQRIIETIYKTKYDL